MPFVSIQERVNGLLTRQVAVSDATGVSRPDLEASSILESVATALLCHPRSALYFGHLARNRFIRLLKDEQALVTRLVETITAFNNTSYAIKDLTSLEKAKTALIQIEAQDALDSKGDAYKRFDSAVSSFLNKQLAKNVRSEGQLIQPGAEARLDLPSYYESLKTAHASMLNAFYALITGIDNFVESPFGTTLGLTATSRARHEIEDIIATLTADDSASTSRDITFRLIAARAALRILGAKPDINAPLIAAADGIRARVKVETTSITLQPPFSIPASFTLGFNRTLTGLTQKNFPVTGANSGEPLVIASAQTNGLYNCPPNGCLFVEITNTWSGGTSIETVNFNSGGVGIFQRTFAQIQSMANAVLGAFEMHLDMVDSRIAIWVTGPSFSKVAIVQSGGDFALASEVSIHNVFGFEAGQFGARGALTQDMMLRMLAANAPTYTLVGNTDGSITVSDTYQTLAVAMSSYPRWGLTANTTVTGTSKTVELYDDSGVVDPSTLLSPGDRLSLGGTTAYVASVSSTSVTLTDATPYYDGQVTAYSSLSTAWANLGALLDKSFAYLTKTVYAKGLAALDQRIAALYGAPTPAQQQAAIDKLNELSTVLQTLLTAVDDPSTKLVAGAAVQDRAVVNSIIATLEEKKYDRALDLLLSCRIQEVFALDWQTVSFAGSLMKAMSSVARNDFVYPNRMKDETDIPAVQKDVS